MSPPRQPTPDRSTPVNHGILSPRVVALRGRIDELIRGTLQLAEKLPTTNGELFPHSRDYESVAPHRLLIAGIRPGDTSRLLNALKAQPINNAAKDDPNAMHQAKDYLRHVNFIEAHDNHPLADSTHEAEFIFFAIPAEDPSHEPSWNHLSTWQESELEKLALVAVPANETGDHSASKCVATLTKIAEKQLGRVLPAFDIRNGIDALRDCLSATLLTPEKGRTLNEALARGEKCLHRIEDQIEELNRKIRQQDRFMDEVERDFDSMRASFAARLPAHIEKVVDIFSHEATIASARLKKRLNPISSIIRLFTGGRVGIRMHSVFTEQIRQAVMQIAATDGETIAASCKEHHQLLKQKTAEEIGAVTNLLDDVGETLARAQEHFLERIEHSAKRGVVNLSFRNPLEKMLRRRNNSLKAFAAVVLTLTTIGAGLGAMGVQWAAILICLMALLFLAGALWVAWASRQSILNDFNQRLGEASTTFAANLHSEYETAIGTLLAEYAATLKPIRAHINREKEALTPLTRRWQELYLGFKALAQDL